MPIRPHTPQDQHHNERCTPARVSGGRVADKAGALDVGSHFLIQLRARKFRFATLASTGRKSHWRLDLIVDRGQREFPEYRASKRDNHYFSRRRAHRMERLPETAADAELIAFVDRWAELLEREDYAAAFALTEHDQHQGWTLDLVRQGVKSYGDAREDQRVTVAGVPSDITQRKKVSRWEENKYGVVGEVWYDLNIDGVAS